MEKFLIRRATIQDVEQICRIMQETEEALEDKSLFVCDAPEYVKEHVEDNGFIVIACMEDGDAAGSFLVRFPKEEEDNLGRDIGLSHEEQMKVAHMESAVVLPKYRGHHLQGRMLEFAENCLDKESYHYLMATVSPQNPASKNTLLKAGYQEILTKEKSGGLVRNILLKEIDTGN